MSLPINSTALKFLVTSDPVADMDREGRQKTTHDGKSKWATEILMSGEGRKSEVIIVKTAGEKPKATEGQRISLTDLAVSLWEVNGNKGFSFSATALEPVPASGKAA